MDHLNYEELARLVDETPTSAEVEHLESCELCAEELREMVGQTIALGELPDRVPPSHLWPALEEALTEEGLVTPSRRLVSHKAGVALRIAAAFALFLSGGAAGALLISPAPSGDSRVASGPDAANVVQAAATLRAAEADYVRAVTRYAELSEGGEGFDPLNRLVALEGIVVTTEAALREAPADPIINNFHLTAVGQRDALMRQIELAANGAEWF